MVEEIRRVSKSKNQKRVTIPKSWKGDYVVVRPLEKLFKEVKRQREKSLKK